MPGRRAIAARRLVGLAVVLLLVGGAGGWALRTLLAPPADVLAAPAYTLVTAQSGTVGHSLRLNTAAQWSASAQVVNQAAGTVTSHVHRGGSRASAGEVLYTVDLRPVVVAEGAVPAFRDLRLGTRGEDVAQLQRMLRALRYNVGAPSNAFGATLDRAVRVWQRDRAVPVDGVVRRGDVLFVPTLPARLSLHPDFVVGASVTGGEPAVQILPAAPTFTISLQEGQARLVEPGMAVQLSPAGATWRAEVTEVRSGEPGRFVATLSGVGGAQICGEACEQIPLGDPTLLPSVIWVVPEVSGVTVPAAAVTTNASGQTGVILASGEFRPVRVLASATGMAVVTGLEPGAQVRNPAGRIEGANR